MLRKNGLDKLYKTDIILAGYSLLQVASILFFGLGIYYDDANGTDGHFLYMALSQMHLCNAAYVSVLNASLFERIKQIQFGKRQRGKKELKLVVRSKLKTKQGIKQSNTQVFEYK